MVGCLCCSLAILLTTGAASSAVGTKQQHQQHGRLLQTGSSASPPSLAVEGADTWVGRPQANRCSDLDQSVFSTGMQCGPPLSPPCFQSYSTECLSNGGIYVFDGECSLQDSSELLAADQEYEVSRTRVGDQDAAVALRNETAQLGMLADTYASACMFVHVGKGLKRPCAVNQPRWNDGANHLLVDMYDKGRASRPDVAGSFAMEAATNMHTCFYRSGYDISVPLAPRQVLHDLANVAPLDREFFLTTKCTLYISGHGSEERISLLPLQDEEHGVVVTMHCFEEHHEQLLPENAEFCQALRDQYEGYDYRSLMNSTFGLVPAGRGPATYRLGEVMSAGSIPVFVGRDLVPPFMEQIDWPSISFAFTPDEVESRMMSTLLAVPRAQLEEMQRKSLEAYGMMFGADVNDFRPSAKIMLGILRRRLGHRRTR
ncbi:unnamed protein product [Ectocarpus sp. 4 AP-2014]